jgi:uncharacterized protein (TIGR03437 family)
MFPRALFLVTALAYSQNYPAFDWAQKFDASGLSTIVGIGSDALGNVYVAGNTASTALPAKNAVQPHLGSAGLTRIDGPGTSYTQLAGGQRLDALAADPINPNVLFGTYRGQSMMSVDGGNSFTNLSIPVPYVYQFAVDPANDRNIWAAIGDTGVAKSADGGATWAVVPKSPLSYVLWIDPNTGAIFASDLGEIYRSGDGGVTWTLVGEGGSVFFETPKPGVIYVFFFQNPNTVAYKSVDDGVTFQMVNIPVASIYADPSRSGRLLGSAGTTTYESLDDGVTWSVVLKGVQLLAADWASGVLWGTTNPGIVQISTDLKTVAPAGPAGSRGTGLIAANGHAYLPNTGGSNQFVAKLDTSGNIIYSTYFGGTAQSTAFAMAVDAAGNTYVTGQVFTDYPTTSGTYAAQWSSAVSGFLFKLRPDGSVAYSTYFPGGTPNAIAVDQAGAAYLTGGASQNLPVTPGAYQSTCACGSIDNGFFSVFYPDSFITKFDPSGSTLVYSTFLGVENSLGSAIAIGNDGSAYVASNYFQPPMIYRLNATGSSLPGQIAPSITTSALAVGPDGNLVVAGTAVQPQFQPTPGAFQTTAPPPALPTQLNNIAAVEKIDPQLQNILAATYFGGPSGPGVAAMTSDASGNIYIGGGTASPSVPTRTPIFGPFSNYPGYLAELSPDLSSLIFSTYLGDSEQFIVNGVALGPGGYAIIGGHTINTSNIWLNGLTIASPQPLRVDAVLNAASLVSAPLSVGETISVRGAGFTSDAQLLLNGSPIATLSITPTQINAVVPANLAGTVAVVQVQTGAGSSNQVPLPIAAASPGIFSVNGTGVGQAYIVNQDGTLNSPAHPASRGDKITLYATGVGPVSFTNGYAVTANPVSVYIDSYYCDGVAAVMGPVSGFAGSVYQLTVYVPSPTPNPDIGSFAFPPLVPVILTIAGQSSQYGLSISLNP